jgi:hypothetical protein
MEDLENEKAKKIDIIRNSIISIFESLKKNNFDLMKSEIAKGCMTDLSLVKNIVDSNIICGEGDTTLESIINEGNNEIKRVIDGVNISDEELDEIKKGILDKLDFSMSKGEYVLYQKVLEIITAYIFANKIANTTKNSLLSAINHLINIKESKK